MNTAVRAARLARFVQAPVNEHESVDTDGQLGKAPRLEACDLLLYGPNILKYSRCR